MRDGGKNYGKSNYCNICTNGRSRRHGTGGEALETVKEFKESGDEVELIFDGGGVTSAVTLADPDSRLHRLYSQVEDKVGGICRYCSRAFEVYDKAEKLGIPFLAEYDQHPSLHNRVAKGFEVITF
jgi:hypothetical protein